MKLSIIGMIILVSSMATIGTDYSLLFPIGLFLGLYLAGKGQSNLWEKYPSLFKQPWDKD